MPVEIDLSVDYSSFTVVKDSQKLQYWENVFNVQTSTV